MAELQEYNDQDILLAILVTLGRIYDVNMAMLDEDTRAALNDIHSAGGLLGSEPRLDPEKFNE